MFSAIYLPCLLLKAKQLFKSPAQIECILIYSKIGVFVLSITMTETPEPDFSRKQSLVLRKSVCRLARIRSR